ncbi:ABC transporter ATP-binding protein [Microbacterium sp. NPDC028030]|uniref:ABC transporter ATP-binding protein n=1 Tax=Microbacterium sp. NPDC028030 TaxID=3155124 RepID=UPI0033DB97F4
MTSSPDDRTAQVDDTETVPGKATVKRTPAAKRPVDTPSEAAKKTPTAKKTAPAKSASAAKRTPAATVKTTAGARPSAPSARSATGKTGAAKTGASKTATTKAATAKAAAEKAAPSAEVVVEPLTKALDRPSAAPRTAAAARTAAAKNTAARAAKKPATAATAKSGTAKTGAATSGAAKTGAAKTGAAKAGAATPGAAKTAAAKSAAAKSAAAKSAAAKSTARSATAKTTAARSAAAKAAATRAAKAAAAKAAAADPDATPAAEMAPAAEPTPVVESSSVVESDAVVVESDPVVESAPVVEASSVVESDPVGEPDSVAEAASSALMAEEGERPVARSDDDSEPTLVAEPEPAPEVEPEARVRAESEAGADDTAAGGVESGPDAEAISIRGLVKQFGDNRAVDGIDLTVPAGSFYGIVGPNGAGKTTTLSIVAGLLRADEGSVVICGIDQSAQPQAAKRLMGVLPDRLRTFDRLTGRQLLYYYGLLRGLPSDVIEKRATDLARAFDLGDALSRVVSDYSAGMTKKIMLAGAMIHSPRVLVLDEPFESVDPVSSAVILDILRAYVSHGGTVILSSHGMDLVERVCSRVAIIVGGEVLAEGTIDEVRAGQTLEARFVELAGSSGEVEGLEWLHTFSD